MYHYCIFIWDQINFGRAFWYQSSQTFTQITISGLPGYWNILTCFNCAFRPLLFLVNWGQYILQCQAMLSPEYQTYSLERYMYIVDSLIIFKYIFFMHHHPGWSWHMYMNILHVWHSDAMIVWLHSIQNGRFRGGARGGLPLPPPPKF